jgi:Tfp pilus assembly protein PilV
VTLLEALVALVILAVAATGFLGLFQQSARAARDAAAWSRAVMYAESGMEAATAGGAPRDSLAGWSRTLSARRRADGLTEVAVAVASPDGVRFTLRRLVAPAGGALGTARSAP